jgi:excisionase family DNA binding protein
MPCDITLPGDLAAIADHAGGRLSFLGRRYLERLADERRITTYRIGGKLLISAAEVESLITALPPLVDNQPDEER